MPATKRTFVDAGQLELSEFAAVCEQATDPDRYPLASGVVKNVVVYDRAVLDDDSRGQVKQDQLKSELAACLRTGPGVFLVRRAYNDLAVIDRCTDVLMSIVATESGTVGDRGDHFGSNQRIWNSLQKTCLIDPELFIAYYANPVIHLAAQAWLGPGYRITAQMNNIRPGAAAQSPHRDYHLGFQPAAQIAQFPLHAQVSSQYLTLQAAIAHCDMPGDTGPTLLLPFSQQYPLGYLAAQRQDFTDYFHQHHVQLPLRKGDALFFNPALVHAGGANRSTVDRIANLLQVSSVFGRTMESLDHLAMIAAVYPILIDIDCPATIERTIASVADGYSFPTNLDLDPPRNGNAPATQQQILRSAIAASLPWRELAHQLDQYEQRRRP